MTFRDHGKFLAAVTFFEPQHTVSSRFYKTPEGSYKRLLYRKPDGQLFAQWWPSKGEGHVLAE